MVPQKRLQMIVIVVVDLLVFAKELRKGGVAVQVQVQFQFQGCEVGEMHLCVCGRAQVQELALERR